MSYSEDIFDNFKKLNVLIIGDVMIDRYVYGKVNRISPEAPVPVVEFQGSEDRLGGAANVALNVKALGATPYLLSITSNDAEGDTFERLLRENALSTEGVIRSQTRMTTVKTRVMAGTQQLLRIDRETTHDTDEIENDLFLKKLDNLLKNNKIHIIIFQDYNKGVLNKITIEASIAHANAHKIPTTVDPKKHNFLTYKNVTLFKPNLKEIREAVPFGVKPEVASLQQAADFLRHNLGHQITMITLTEKGIFVESPTEGGQIYPTQPRNISDVSGAGDTVISVASLGLASGFDMKTIAHISNIAGGQVCEIPGVVPVNLERLKREVLNSKF
jgi:rfaE bifunctional protein kinase chain/domain